MQNIFDIPNPKIVVCSPMPVVDGRLEPITVEWHRARQNLIPPFNANYREVGIDGLAVDEARNKAAQCCLDCNAKFLFFNDYDVILPPDSLHRLYYDAQQYPEIDVFSGVYCVKQDPPIPLIYKGKEKEIYWDWCPGDILIDDVTGCPMGVCLIRVNVFRKLSNDKPWFKTIPNQCSEDIWFLNRIQDELNGKILIDTNIICSHINNKTGILYGLPEDSLPIRRYKEKHKE